MKNTFNKSKKVRGYVVHSRRREAQQLTLFTIYPHKYFVDVDRIAETLMSTFQPFGILRAELVAPQTNRFIAYGNTAYSQRIFDVSMAEVKAMVQPDRILNDFGGKPVALA